MLKIILVACDMKAIDPETRKTIFFEVFIKSKGDNSVADKKNAPKMMVCIFGDISKLSPDAA